MQTADIDTAFQLLQLTCQSLSMCV